MGRKPSRSRHLVRSLPATFSGFSRYVHANKLIRQNRTCKTSTQVSPSSGKVLRNLPMHNESDQAESSDDEEFEGVVQADFAFFDPKPDDFHGVKVLLKTYLDDKEWDLSGFVELILGQTTVGTVIKIEEDEDDGVYAVATVLNLGRYKDHNCIMELKKFLLKVCLEERILHYMSSILGEQSHDVGLLISQRVVNLPPQLLPPLYDALFDEISWATEDEPTKDLRKSFCFKSYLFVSKIYKHKKADQKQDTTSNNTDEAVIYVKPEDELFHKLSSWSFTFRLHNQQGAAHELKHYKLMGLVMAVEATKVSEFREQLRCLIDE